MWAPIGRVAPEVLSREGDPPARVSPSKAVAERWGSRAQPLPR